MQFHNVSSDPRHAELPSKVGMIAAVCISDWTECTRWWISAPVILGNDWICSESLLSAESPEFFHDTILLPGYSVVP